MKLASRVSLFLLAGLTVMLVVNSVLLYAGARFYLYLRFEDQLESEVEEDDVKWEPSDHTVTLGAGRDVDDIRWVVADESGRIVDHSRNLLTRAAAAALVELSRQDLNRRPRQSDWQISQQSLAAPHPKHPAERSPLEHARLHIVVARSRAPLQRTLSWLILGLIVVPALGWLVIALGGRWLCLHAIAPVTAMAENIRRFQANDACARLDVPATRDELQDLGGAFNELLDRLFVAIDRQRRFAGDAAHQLRTPLTVLQG